ncbi:MAG TPA: winged helix-turn-helix domain-containing protein [Candidatus Angelobacter sp.]|nr:winged helix-turn-helix domain-containing protein [Candidatus Angelobacter sp.]
MSTVIKNLLEFGPFRVDPEQRVLLRGQDPIPLSPKAFDLLLVLAQRSGQVVLKDELMTLLWPDTFVEESNLGQHVFQLRKALGDPSYIVTVPGRGYRFAHRVRTIPANDNNEELVPESRLQPVIEKEEIAVDRAPVSATKHHRMLFAALVAVVVLLVAAVALFLSTSPSPKVLRVRQITHSGRVAPFGKVLSDGARLYFTERRGGAQTLAQVPVAGGESTSISTTVPSLTVYDIDPEKARLLIGSQGARFDQPLWVIPTTGGAARRVGDILASEGTVWSADGDSILYGHDSQIYKVDDSGEAPGKLLAAPGYVISLRASPDGNLLRFTVRDSNTGVQSLWESSGDGGNVHPFLPGWSKGARHWGEGENSGDWTPDGRYFVFRAVHEGVESFWAIREKRGWFPSRPVQLYATPDRLSDPRFSPDGKTMFFVNFQERRELVRYDSVQKLFLPYLGGIPIRLLSFSKDGQWLAYRNETDGTLWRSRADGTEKLQLTFAPMDAYHSTWSPDGKGIIFGGRLPGQPGRLYRISRDGGKPEVLTEADATDGEPSWSPDGRSIIFQRWIRNETGTRHSAIYVLELSTHQTRMLAGTQDFDGVHLSPDGRYAAASDETHEKVMLFDLKSQQWSELADGPAYGWGIRWSSDSLYVYYQLAAQGEEQPIFRVRVSDRKVEQITSARQILRADVLGYTLTGLTPDGSPVASLVRRNSDVYALELDLP